MTVATGRSNCNEGLCGSTARQRASSAASEPAGETAGGVLKFAVKGTDSGVYLEVESPEAFRQQLEAVADS